MRRWTPRKRPQTTRQAPPHTYLVCLVGLRVAPKTLEGSHLDSGNQKQEEVKPAGFVQGSDHPWIGQTNTYTCVYNTSYHLEWPSNFPRPQTWKASAQSAHSPGNCAVGRNRPFCLGYPHHTLQVGGGTQLIRARAS